jgi:hypothetical protein
VANYLFAVYLLYHGFRDLKIGMEVATIQGEGWEAERAQVEHWLDVLRGKEKQDKVVEILERAFRWDDFTYRFLNAGTCWAVAIFKRGKEHKLPIDYSVWELSAISLMEEPGGILTAQVDGKVIPKRRKAAA